MTLHQNTALTIFFSLVGTALFGQAPYLQLTLRYNPTLTRYEVYALPDATQSVFNWGPSQISIVAPAAVPDAAFTVTLVAGGAWLDNSQVYAPSVDPAHDFHGVGSLGAITSLVQGVEKLIFHFTLPGGGCTSGLRLFINDVDPNSSAAGMNGGDFSNTIFAIVTGVPMGYEAYIGNYNNGGTSCAPLPLELTDFHTIANQETIDLFWETANELNFDHFELERAVNALNFKTIGKRAPQAGNGGHHYAFTDNSAMPGTTYYYRLKMVDDDGFFIYSNAEQAKVGKTGLEITNTSPNPTSDKTTIRYHTSEEDMVTMTLHDGRSNLLETETLLPRTGANEYTIDLKRYPPGVYWLQLISETDQKTTKIIRVE
jgi:hypothetical protein